MTDPDPFDGLAVFIFTEQERRLIAHALHTEAVMQDVTGYPDSDLIATCRLKSHILGDLEEVKAL